MTKNYDISFFKPNSEFSRKNRNLVLWLVLVWAIAVFGFQILLKIVEKPVPEEALTEFIKVKDNVFAGSASVKEKQIFLKSLINVVNKNTLHKEKEIPLIKKAINWTAFSLFTDKIIAIKRINAITESKLKILEISNLDEYRAERQKIRVEEKKFVNDFANDLNLNPKGIRTEIFMSVLTPNSNLVLSESDKSVLPSIMDKYLIHNRSFLTDTTFIGFPFHYFYSAVFLLILFIALCYVYAIQIERLNKKFDIVE